MVGMSGEGGGKNKRVYDRTRKNMNNELNYISYFDVFEIVFDKIWMGWFRSTTSVDDGLFIKQ